MLHLNDGWSISEPRGRVKRGRSVKRNLPQKATEISTKIFNHNSTNSIEMIELQDFISNEPFPRKAYTLWKRLFWGASEL